jgi:predicted lipoprotein
MKNPVKYILGILAILVVLYFSFDIRKLNVYKSENNGLPFDAILYANDVWENKLPEVAGQAPELTYLIELLESDPESAFTEFGKKLGISKTWYFFAKGEGEIDSAGNETIWVKITDDRQIQLATAFIFGNAVREGSGVVNIDDFINMTDFNNVSVALNKMVKNEIIPVLIKNSRTGRRLKFSGVFEINEEKIDLNAIRIIPVSISFEHAE